MAAIKLLGLGALAGVLANVVGDTAALIGVIAAGVAGASYLAARTFSLLRDVHKLVRRVLSAYQILEAMPPWMEGVNAHNTSVDERLGRLETKTDAAREPAEAMARELGIPHRNP